jgi:hypothetical protein
MSKTDYLELRIEGTMPVNTYREWLIMAYKTAASGRMTNMRVASLHLIKQVTVPSLHEYVVAHITAPDTTERYLALERKNGGELQAPSRSDSSLTISVKRTNESRRDSGDTSIASLDSFSKKTKHAKDIFEVLQGPLHDEKDQTLLRLVFDKEPFYLFQLVNWAVILHEEEKSYKTFSKNCYWFTGTLVEVLKDHYGLDIQDGDGKQEKKQGKGKGKGKEKEQEKEEEKARRKGKGEELQGTWHQVRTFEPPKMPRPDIFPKYSEILRNFEEQVSSVAVLWVGLSDIFRLSARQYHRARMPQ